MRMALGQDEKQTNKTQKLTFTLTEASEMYTSPNLS